MSASARIARAIARHPALVLFACLAFVGGLATGIRRLEIDRSIDAVIMPDDPDKPFLEEMKSKFGSDEIVVVALVVPKGDVFNPATLGKVKALTAALAAIPGVDHVKSLSNARHITSTPEGIRTDPLFRDPPSDPRALADIRRRALSDPLFVDNLVSRDGRATALICFFAPEVDKDPKKQFPAAVAIEEKALAFAAPERVYVSGVPLNKVANSHMARHDLRVVGPFLLLANALIVTILYRSLRGLVLPVLAILSAVAATLGLMGWLHIPINTYTNYVPFFLIMLGACYSVYTVTSYYQNVGEAGLRAGTPRAGRANVIERLLQEHLGPFALIVVTTFAGFFSLVTNRIPAVWQLGLLTAIGALVLYPVCGLGLPAALCLLDAPRKLPPKPREAPGQWLWIRIARLGTERSSLMIGIWVVLLAGSVWLATKIDVSTNSLEFLPENHPLRVSERAIQENLGGTAVLNAFIETGGEDAAIEPESLARLARLQAYARSLPETDSTLSVIDYLEPLKLALDAGAIEASTSVPAPLSRTAPEGRVLPKTREEAAELLLIYSHPEDIARYIDEGRSWLRLMLRLNKRSSEDLTRVSKEIQGEAARLGFAPDAVHVASTLRLIADSLDEVAYQMAVSIFTSVSTVFPLLLLLTKSLRAGIIAMIPNTVPSILVFGFMGIFGYKLDVASSTIASITLGIAVDDTIHFLAKFRRLREGGTTMVEALEFGLREGGPAMLFSTGVLSLSLLITNVSGYVPVRSLGQLASFGFFICLMADLTLHPALLAKFAPRKWKGAALPEEVRERARRAEATLSEAIGERISGNWRSFAEAADEAHVSPPRAGAPDMPDTRETPRTAAPPSPVPAERAERGKE